MSSFVMKSRILVKSAKADSYVYPQAAKLLGKYKRLHRYELGSIYKPDDEDEYSTNFVGNLTLNRAQIIDLASNIKYEVKKVESDIRKTDVKLLKSPRSIQWFIDEVKAKRKAGTDIFCSPVTVTWRVTIQHIVPKSEVTADMDVTQYREAKTYYYSKSMVIDANIPVIGVGIKPIVNKIINDSQILFKHLKDFGFEQTERLLSNTELSENSMSIEAAERFKQEYALLQQRKRVENDSEHSVEWEFDESEQGDLTKPPSRSRSSGSMKKLNLDS